MEVLRFSAMIVLFFTYINPREAGLIGDCWEAWSRCSKWSEAATGILWDSCNDRCKELGRRCGKCVLVSSKCFFVDKALQCQCFNTYEECKETTTSTPAQSTSSSTVSSVPGNSVPFTKTSASTWTTTTTPPYSSRISSTDSSSTMPGTNPASSPASSTPSRDLTTFRGTTLPNVDSTAST